MKRLIFVFCLAPVTGSAVNLGGPCDPADPAVAKLEQLLIDAKACEVDDDCIYVATPVRSHVVAINHRFAAAIKKAQTGMYCDSGIGEPIHYDGIGCRARVCDEGHAPTAAITSDLLIVPGLRVGPIDQWASEEGLRAMLGEKHVTPTQVYLGEGLTEPGTLVYPNDRRRLEVVWTDDSRTRPKEVRLSGEASSWATVEGFSLGTALKDIERVNRYPFRLAGFGFDYGGTITDCGRGRLAMFGCTQAASITPRVVFRLSVESAARNNPLYRQVLGDRVFSSGHPAMQALNPRVYQIIVPLPP